jgi:hypothetical protein
MYKLQKIAIKNQFLAPRKNLRGKHRISLESSTCQHKKPRVLFVKTGTSLINNAIFEEDESRLAQLADRMNTTDIKDVA